MICTAHQNLTESAVISHFTILYLYRISESPGPSNARSYFGFQCTWACLFSITLMWRPWYTLEGWLLLPLKLTAFWDTSLLLQGIGRLAADAKSVGSKTLGTEVMYYYRQCKIFKRCKTRCNCFYLTLFSGSQNTTVGAGQKWFFLRNAQANCSSLLLEN